MGTNQRPQQRRSKHLQQQLQIKKSTFIWGCTRRRSRPLKVHGGTIGQRDLLHHLRRITLPVTRQRRSTPMKNNKTTEKEARYHAYNTEHDNNKDRAKEPSLLLMRTTETPTTTAELIATYQQNFATRRIAPSHQGMASPQQTPGPLTAQQRRKASPSSTDLRESPPITQRAARRTEKHCSEDISTGVRVLVYHDLLGMLQHPHHAKVTPKFCKQFGAVGDVINKSLSDFKQEVENRVFPGPSHTPYKIAADEVDGFLKELGKLGLDEAASAAAAAAVDHIEKSGKPSSLDTPA